MIVTVRPLAVLVIAPLLTDGASAAAAQPARVAYPTREEMPREWAYGRAELAFRFAGAGEVQKDYAGISRAVLFPALGIDALYRPFDRLALGVYGQTATAHSSCTHPPCNDDIARAGVQAIGHALPGRIADPWLGLGAGYAWFSQESDIPTVGVVSTTWSGPEYVNVQLGVDFGDTSRYGIGPYVSYALGHYTEETGTHDWFFVGVRAGVLIGP